MSDEEPLTLKCSKFPNKSFFSNLMSLVLIFLIAALLIEETQLTMHKQGRMDSKVI